MDKNFSDSTTERRKNVGSQDFYITEDGEARDGKRRGDSMIVNESARAAIADVIMASEQRMTNRLLAAVVGLFIAASVPSGTFIYLQAQRDALQDERISFLLRYSEAEQNLRWTAEDDARTRNEFQQQLDRRVTEIMKELRLLRKRLDDIEMFSGERKGIGYPTNRLPQPQ